MEQKCRKIRILTHQDRTETFQEKYPGLKDLLNNVAKFGKLIEAMGYAIEEMTFKLPEKKKIRNKK